MRGLVKTLVGDARNFVVALACIMIGAGFLLTKIAVLAGLVLPLLLLGGAAYLAKH